MVQEHEVDLGGQVAGGVESADRGVAGADDDTDHVAKTGEVDEGGDDGGELRVALEAEVASAAGVAEGGAEEEA